MEHMTHKDPATRRSAITCVAQLAQGDISSLSLVDQKMNLLEILKQTRSDKNKPVREITGKCLSLVRLLTEYENIIEQVAHTRNQQNLATFSPNQIRTSESDVDFVNNILNQEPMSAQNYEQ